MPSETEPQVDHLQIAPDKKKKKDKASGSELLGNLDWYWTLQWVLGVRRLVIGYGTEAAAAAM